MRITTLDLGATAAGQERADQGYQRSPSRYLFHEYHFSFFAASSVRTFASSRPHRNARLHHRPIAYELRLHLILRLELAEDISIIVDIVDGLSLHLHDHISGLESSLLR